MAVDHWLTLLSDHLDVIGGEETRKTIMAGSEHLHPIPRCPFFAWFPLDLEERLRQTRWIQEALERVDELIPEKERREILSTCACRYPKAALKEIRHLYEETKDIDRAHNMLKNRFIKGIRRKFDKSLAHNLEEWGWGLAGVKKGRTIRAVKMPFQLTEYLKETDPVKKRYHYCHCARVREAIKHPEIQISITYCYCAAGFYKAIWEEITQQPVQVEVLSSVLRGDDVCKIAIMLS